MTVHKVKFLGSHLFGQRNRLLLASPDQLQGAPHSLRALELVVLPQDVGKTHADEGKGLLPVKKHLALQLVLTEEKSTYP